MSLMSQAPAVFTSSDCISAVHSAAAECCPQLVSLYRSMGIDDANITFLLYELQQHVQAVFTTTYREAEEERQRLLIEIEQQTLQIPLLAREVDDASALNELAAIGGGGGGLRAKAEGVKALWTRLTEVKQLSGKVIQDGLRELGLLYREVGVAAEAQLMERDAGDFSAKKVNRIKEQIVHMQNLRADHIAQVNQRAASTLRLCEELGVTPDEFTLSVSTPHFVLSEIRDASGPPSTSQSGSTSSVSSLSAHSAFTFSSLLSCLDKRLERLLQHKQHQQLQADRQLQLITSLWARLDIPPQQQQSFLQSTARQPLSEQSMRLYAEEAARLERLKAERMGGLVEAVRREIVELWQRLHFTQAQRLLFRPHWLQPAVYDDALLALHEAERDRLLSVYAEWKPLLQMVEKRAEYRQQLSEHEISIADPDRLVSRQRTAYLLLKEEEKMRNIAGKWLPKLEQQLLERLERWEAEHREPFMLDGQRCVDRIRQEMNDWQHNARLRREAAEQAKLSKTTERQSMLERRTGNRNTLQHDLPLSAGKSVSARPAITPARAAAAPQAVGVKRQLLPSTPVSASGGVRKAVPLFDSRGGQYGYSGAASSSTPTKEISRTTPLRLQGRGTPKTGNKENSSV